MKRIFAALALIAFGGTPLAAAEPAPVAEQALKFGRCLVNADRSAAIVLFQHLPADSSAIDPGTMRVGNGAPCLKGTGMLPTMQLRGAIAEGLYAHDFREAGLQPRRAAVDFAGLNLPEGASDTSGTFALSRCVARSRFTVVDKLFATPAGSRRESEFIAGLMPYFAACQPQGTQIALKRGDIRALLAQSVYEVNVRYWANQITAAR